VSDGNEIYLLAGEEVHGPFARADVVEGLTSGDIPPETLATCSQDEEWRPISSIIQVAVSDQTKEALLTETVKIPLPPK